MASRQNSNFAYINLINGETVWERLRNVRNFLEGRIAAKAGFKAQELRREALEAKIEEALETNLKSAVLEAKVNLIEFMAHQAAQQDGYNQLLEEIEFLTKYEVELSQAAEQYRIEGKTDHEMYQLNMPYEVYLRNIKKIQAEKTALTMGISQATAEEAMRIPLLKKQMLATATLMCIPKTEENALMIEDLQKEAINFENIPLSVQEELKLDDTLLLGFGDTLKLQ